MREIKFRVWDKVDYMSTPFTLYNIQKKEIEFTNDVILMQFTGLKDKNGKEIYEGDIIKLEYADNDFWIYEIIYVEQKACFSLNSPNRFVDIMATIHDTSLTMLYQDRFEIIGNIYENPELLK